MGDTKDIIRERILSNIDNTYDKSEGSFFYDVAASIAIELEKAYLNADSILNKGFVDTSTGKNLDKIVGEVGITRKLSVRSSGKVTITGTVGATINSGIQVASDSLTFLTTESVVIPSGGSVQVAVECTSYGSVGNVPLGAIKYFPVTISGLQTVTNAIAFTNGYDEESDSELRSRYYTKVQTPATSGNIYHYLNWSKEVTGVGDAKVIPLWNGNGTVKVIIINSNKVGADATLIENVTSHIEENRPIGATVTVISAVGKSINISFSLTLETGYIVEDVKTNIENTIISYLKDIAFVKDYVSYAKIGAFILDAEGVIDYSNLLVNNGTDNIYIGNEEVAVLGGVTLG